MRMSRQHKEKAQKLDIVKYNIFSKLKHKPKEVKSEGTLVKCFKCKATHTTLYKIADNVYACDKHKEV